MICSCGIREMSVYVPMLYREGLVHWVGLRIAETYGTEEHGRDKCAGVID